MRSRNATSCLLTMLTALVATSARGADEFVAHDMKPRNFEVHGINEAGQVVGRYYDRPALITPEMSGDAVTWYRDDDVDGVNDLMTILPTLGGADGWALGINASGQIVGTVEDAAQDLYPVLWDGQQVIQLDEREWDGWASDINDSGLIAGLLEWATLYDSGGLVAELDDVTYGYNISEPFDINNAGVMVGYYDGDLIAAQQAFTWDGVTLTLLPGLGDDTEDSLATAINDIGQVVGVSWQGGDARIALWEAGVVSEVDPSEGRHSVARGINNLGQIVGWRDFGAPYYCSGFLYLPEPDYGLAAGTHFLHDLVPAGTSLPRGDCGWAGTFDSDHVEINDDGVILLRHEFILAPADYSVVSCSELTLSHTGSGSTPTASPTNSLDCDPGKYLPGEVIGLTAQPDEGWGVGSWSGTDNDASTASTNTVTMPASSHAATVHYAPEECYPLVLRHLGMGADPVANPTSSEGCDAGEFVPGARIVITATPDPEWVVGSWLGTDDDLFNENFNSVTMPTSGHVAEVIYIFGEARADFTWSPENPMAEEDEVQFTDLSTGEELTWAWDFDSDGHTDSTTQNPTLTFADPGPHQVTLSVSNAYGADSVTRTVLVSSEAPYISGVKRQFPGFFIDGTTAKNKFEVTVEWQGSPGWVEFTVGGSTTVVDGTEAGASYTFDMGKDFDASFSASVVTIKPTNGEATEGETWEESIYVFPVPEWLATVQTLGLGVLKFETKGGEVKAKLDWKFPNPTLGPFKVDIPDAVPYLAGELGIEQTFAQVKGEVSSRGTGSLSLQGKSGFAALGGSVVGSLGGTGKFVLVPPSGLELSSASFQLGLAGTIKKEVGLLEAIPQVAFLAGYPLLSNINEVVQIKGEIKPSLELAARFFQKFGELEFDDVQAALGLGLKATLEGKIPPVTLSGWVAGGGKVTVGLPEPLMRELAAHVEVGVGYKFDMVWELEGKYVCRAVCKWKHGQGVGCGLEGCGDSEPELPWLLGGEAMGLSLIDVDYSEFGEYSALTSQVVSRPANSAIPQATETTTVVSNVFQGASPAMAELAGERLLVWVHQDPLDPVLQSAEIFWSYHDGIDWSIPAGVADDTQAELHPDLGVDSNGDVVGVWQRNKIAAFSTPIESVEDLPLFYKQLEVVSAVFDPVLGSWSVTSQLTDDEALDADLEISSDGAGGLMLTWLSNAGGEFLSDATHPTSLMVSFWDAGGQAWSPPAAIDSGLEGVASHAAAFDGDKAFVIVPRDPSVGTSDDGELDLYTWNGATWSGPTLFADGGVENRIPLTAYDGSGEGHVLWLRDEDLVQATLSDFTPQVVRSASRSLGFYGARLVVNGTGNLTLVWQDVAASGPAQMFTMVYDTDAGVWSTDLQLTEEEGVKLHSLDALFDSGGDLQVAHLATTVGRTSEDHEIDGEMVSFTNLPVDLQTDLRVLEHTLATDLAVQDSDLTVSPFAPELDDEVTAALIVHNAGDFAVTTGFAVDLYLGNPEAGGVLVASSDVLETVLAGSTRTLDFMFIHPGGGGDLVAVVDSMDDVAESSESNNRATAWLSNRPPVPIAIADATIGTAPFEVYLDGAESFDPEGGSLEYLWTFGDGSLPGEGTTLSHTFEEPGLYTVSLAVTDDQNAGAIATVEIAVENPDYSGCYAVSDLTISALAIDGAEFFEACDTVTVGPDIEVLSTGYLFLKAGNSVVLNNGFSVVGEGELVIEVDP